IWKKARRLASISFLDVNAASYRLRLKEDRVMVATLLIFGLLLGLGLATIVMIKRSANVSLSLIKFGGRALKIGLPGDQKPDIPRGEVKARLIGEPHSHHGALTFEFVPSNQRAPIVDTNVGH